MGIVLFGPNIDAEDQHVKNRVKQEMCNLRKFLRDVLQLPDGWDAVPCVDRTEAAWTISLPPAELKGGAA